MNLGLLSNQNTKNGKEAIKILLSSCLKSSEPGVFFASQPDPDRYFYRMVVETYKSIGYEIEQYLDFEDGYGVEEFNTALSRPFIHLSGGNTFRFLKSLRERGVENRLVEYVKNGGILIGVSAGAMILTPSIESAFICGDENAVGLDDLRGLGLVSFMFDPHSSKKNSRIEALKSKEDLLMASDDDAFILVNGEELLVGTPKLIERVTA
ncbi:Type 1 glutamine amidotransferase-like domain-containing protein [Reinekea thalattae]|uniref:Peptidase S51 n=1 Tax=Reinekea thalattae TaxID=2593301 RepID=A0A5C8Z906_9GAMM|nr:Type 1 glutamine amidotransferase-like domain-containing protein [Reinekea thalattae]TXR53844.1 peptidase S51 [Reinekea thalattae]